MIELEQVTEIDKVVEACKKVYYEEGQGALRELLGPELSRAVWGLVRSKKRRRLQGMGWVTALEVVLKTGMLVDRERKGS